MADFTRQEVFTEALWRKYARSPNAFFQSVWHIQHPEHGAILFEMFDAQRRALDIFQSERYVITLKARQIGWTTIVAAYAFWLAYFHPDRTIIFLSKGEREAKQILDKVKYGFRRLPDWLRSRGPNATADNQQNLPFDNGSGIESLPSKSDPARGRTAYLVVVDEWAFLENPEEAWASIEPIADVGGRVIGLSTANGIGNFFFELWTRAETGVSNFATIFEPWSARADRDENWYESKRCSMATWQLHQEYPRTPEEAFIKSGNPFFDVDKLRGLPTEDGRRGNVMNREFRTFVEYDDGNLEIWLHPDANGTLSDLPKLGDKYVIGVDVAEGLDHGDYSSVHVKHLRSGLIVAHWHGHIPADELAEVITDLGQFYNAALVGVENNNHGLTTCVALKQLRYPNIFYSRILDERTRRETKKVGWTTSRKTKPMMLDDLYAALRDDATVVRCRRTIAELCGFIRDENAKLHGSPFDDRVMSLAITEQMAEYAAQYDFEVTHVEWGQLAWWDQTIGEPKGRRPIGAHNVRARVA